MRNQNRKDRPGFLCKRGGSSGADGADGGGTKKKYVKDVSQDIPDMKVLPPEMDLMDVFDDIEVVAKDIKVQEAQNLIREALNLPPGKEIPDMVSSADAAKIMRKIAFKSGFNLKTSGLNHYLNY